MEAVSMKSRQLPTDDMSFIAAGNANISETAVLLQFRDLINLSMNLINSSLRPGICASEESKPPSVRDGIQLSAIPELGWTSVISALFWLAPTGFRRFIRFPRDLSLAASSL
jgi:hypothetical protein